MTREQKLLNLLQPKEYKSKIKLYCRDNEFKIKKFGDLKNIPYICRIKIEDI